MTALGLYLGHAIAAAGRWFDGLPVWWRAAVGVLVLLSVLVMPMVWERWAKRRRA